MAKAYWISTYRAINDPDEMAPYAALAKPAIESARGSSSRAACRRLTTSSASASA